MGGWKKEEVALDVRQHKWVGGWVERERREKGRLTWPGSAMVMTASVTASVIRSAISSASLVRKEVRAMLSNSSRSVAMSGWATWLI